MYRIENFFVFLIFWNYFFKNYGIFKKSFKEHKMKELEKIYKTIVEKSNLLFDKNYSPEEIERTIYQFWKSKGFLESEFPKKDQKTFCIVAPPPNITGKLHIGHALQYSIIDMMIRYRRMRGDSTLLKCGIDHAGIATQIVVEKYILDRYKKNRIDFGKKEFIKKIWDWKKEIVQIMDLQMRCLGNLVPKRYKFTMDQDVSEAVTSAFIKLYEDRLIYQAKKLVNWDPKLKTVISDLEVGTERLEKIMWYIRYPIIGEEHRLEEDRKFIVIATSDPETIFGDSAVAVHPSDNNKKHLVGREVSIPIVNRKIPIISDSFVDMKKGTGFVRITPAHNFQDYEVSINHDLPIIEIFDKNRNMQEFARVFFHSKEKEMSKFHIPSFFRKKDDMKVRREILEHLESSNLLVGNKKYISKVNYSERSKSRTYPILTDQWFIKVKPFIQEAISAVRDKRIEFFPKKYENIYFSWMKRMKDWCISRQLWWGHRIPIWYDESRKIYVGNNEEDVRRKYFLKKNTKLIQEKDVLDTWFSSSLWIFVSFGWPKKNKSLSAFQPTDILVSGFDIIFFWISRMIMMTMYFIKDEKGCGKVPFRKVYITGLICDQDGQKMSKSRSNIVDPISFIGRYPKEFSKLMIYYRRTETSRDMHFSSFQNQKGVQDQKKIRLLGADSLRLTLISLSSGSRKIYWNTNQLYGYQNFCNKLWHASRFILNNVGQEGQNVLKDHCKKKFSLDRWIIFKLKETVSLYRIALDSFRFDMASKILYKFVWNQFCDWYLEFSKISIQDGDKERKISVKNTLLMVLEEILKLSHPMIPFVSEFIWQNILQIKKIDNKKSFSSILENSFPIGIQLKELKEKKNIKLCFEVELIKRFISTLRNLKSQFNSSEEKIFKILITKFSKNEIRKIFYRYFRFINQMIKIPIFIIEDEDNEDKKVQYHHFLIKSFENLLELRIVFFNPSKDDDPHFLDEKKLRKKLDKLEKEKEILQRDLKNIQFLKKAPKKIIVMRERRIQSILEQRKILLRLIKNKTLFSSHRIKIN